MLHPALVAAYRWRLRHGSEGAVGPAVAALLAAGRAIGLSERQVRLLAGRGHGVAELPSFVGPAEDGLHDPWLLPDASLVVERVGRALRDRHAVLVFGDFDADGLTGLAILVEAFRALGLETQFHVPSRVADGHGLSRRAVEEAAARGCRLIVTVDCGTASADEIALARAREIDVIVTDHHHVPAERPPAVAFVNPQRPDSRYPDARISGAGVAFKVAQLVLGELAAGGASEVGGALELAELAAIGTVADVAPLLGENRAIARLGLARMRERPRPGIAALLARAGVAPDQVDVETIGYVVAPRLNAAGRLGDARVAAQLLLARDDQEASSLAAELEAANSERRGLLGSALDEARQSLGQADGPIVAAVGSWSPGIIGLVAGRLAEEHRRPAIVVSAEVLPWRASARSANGFDLARAFETCADLLERHGGHRDAAGCSFAPGSWESLRARLVELAGALPPPEPISTLAVDLAVPASEVEYRLLRELAILEPSGPGNPAALIAVLGIEVMRARVVNGGHSQLVLRKRLEALDAVAFERPEIAAAVTPGDLLDIVGRLTSRAFGGYESLQLEVRDAAPAGQAPWVTAVAPAPVSA